MTAHVDVQDNLPLTEATFFIMLSLAPGPSHGYAIIKDVEKVSDSRVLKYEHAIRRSEATARATVDHACRRP